MPGPKMGARPPDFNEELVKQSPTYIKWLSMPVGTTIRYACRSFTKGKNADEEERLMRRIMIARRNNLRDHDNLKRARIAVGAQQEETTTEQDDDNVDESNNDVTTSTTTQQDGTTTNKKRKADASGSATTAADGKKAASRKSSSRAPKREVNLTDEEVAAEMDVPAIEATRSYKTWLGLKDGQELTYNQKYTKGKDNHDWLLRKNIWRRMKYRRENKKIVQALVKGGVMGGEETTNHILVETSQKDNSDIDAADVVQQVLAAAAADDDPEQDFVNKAVVEAAVAAAESCLKTDRISDSIEEIAAMTAPTTNLVHNPLEGNEAALDAAAKLAAATAKDEVMESAQV